MQIQYDAQQRATFVALPPAAIIADPSLSLGELGRRFTIRPESARKIKIDLREAGLIPPRHVR